MKIKNIPIHEIHPYENNPRLHPVRQLEAITNSIKRFGFRGSILIDSRNIIVAGHARYEAAAVAGLSEIPCEYADDLTEEEIAAYRILDNKIAAMSYDDNEKLMTELEKLPDFDFSEFGVEFPEIEKLPISGLCDEDEVPELKVEATTKPGDVWILGSHRLLCGNSTEVEAVTRLLGELNPNLMVTDPPYGVEYDPSWPDKSSLGVGKRSTGKVENDEIVEWTDAYSMFTGNVAYIWHAGKYAHLVAKNLTDCGFEIISQIIWAKNNFAISRGDYHWKHEPCWYVVREGEKHDWQGARDQSTIWDIQSTHQTEENAKIGHGTQKPVECMLRPIVNNSKANDYIYDPFGGSGTTLIACEKAARKCLMMEISSAYCDLIVKRWQKFSGGQAVLESSGEKFNELSPLV